MILVMLEVGLAVKASCDDRVEGPREFESRSSRHDHLLFNRDHTEFGTFASLTPSWFVEPLLCAFPAPDYFLDEQSIATAIAQRSMFNLIDVRGGDKVDFWMLTDEPFDQSRFARRISEEVLGTTLVVSKPEDTILAKLRWAKLSGGSEKQFRDALRVYEIQQPNLDLKYLEDWSQRLGVSELWSRLQQEAEPL